MINFQTYCKSMKALTMSLILTVSATAFAEDTEIFSNAPQPQPPNVLVILDNSGSMTTLMDSGTETRMEALTSAFQTFVNNPDVQDVNIGLMAFSNGGQDPRPHGISVPISPIDDEAEPIMMSNLIPAIFSTPDNYGFFSIGDDNLPDPIPTQTIRQYLPQIIGNWTASGGTPIVDSLHEAALYFKGAAPKWGYASAEQVNAAHPSSYVGNIIATKTQTLTGSTKVCILPDCGINCAQITQESECAAGETSCYTGNNCFTQTELDWNRCDLSSVSACLASNPSYTSCNAESDTDCSTTCSGVSDPETGVCLGTETTSCTTDDYFECYIPEQVTSCDRIKYRCDEVDEVKVSSGPATYTSPITGQCESNIIILMSDGAPNANADEATTDTVRNEIKTLIGHTGNCADVAGQVVPVTGTNTLADGRCGPELAAHLATVDQSTADGDNTVKTYTVGFAVNGRPEAEAYLRSLAASGDGEYYPANDEAALAAAFMSALNDTLASSKSFAAPVYTVNPDTLLSHSNDIYLPLFQNTAYPGWVGNLKKFKLNSAGEIIDANGALAFDNEGSLKPEAVDYWMPTGSLGSANADPIADGGFANNIVPGVSRKLLTDNGLSLEGLNDTNVSKAELGNSAMSDAEKEALLDYIQGYEADGTTARKAIGDILHSKPTFISYGANKKALFFGTNEGFLHAIDAADASGTGSGGSELFAFMPSSLLGNIDGLHKNTALPAGGLSRIYGVDGSISAIITDNNDNGSVDSADGDTATLVFGLRRGGTEYYALDVTDPDSPSLKWKITNTGDFSNLGETWSKPKHAKLRYLQSGTAVLADVLVFGGGYDNNLDEEDTTLRANDTKGNAVYIVNLETGEHIWSYSGNLLNNSVPGDIRTLDMDDDGSIDRLYFGDTGGNLWRADLTAFDSEPGRTRYDIANNSLVTHFASLGGSGADKRKFFFEPDVSIFRSAGKEALLVAVGSGYRAHPLNVNVSDRFYVLSDENVRTLPSTTQAPLTDSDLVSAAALNGVSFFPAQKGWYKDLTIGTGEKVLASPITFLSKIAFTTFAVGSMTTTAVDANGCSIAGSNVASAYVLDLLTGDATVDLDGDGNIDANDESTVVENGNILDTPQIVFNEPSNCTTDGCDYFVDLRVGNKSTPLINKDTLTSGASNNLGESLQKMYWISK